jgi:hypothetical protein
MDPGVKTLKSRRSEGVIKRNEDGSTSVVYPDSDDEEGISVEENMGEETTVVKGEVIIGYADNRIDGNCSKAQYAEYKTPFDIGSSVAAEFSG